MNVQASVGHNEGKDIAITAFEAGNQGEIAIKIFTGDMFTLEDLIMNVPISSAK